MAKNYSDYTREQLLEEIKKLKQKKKFGLVWEEKTEKVVEECKTNFPVLQEVPGFIIAGNDPQSPTHLIIEGDNYHSLSVLNVTHKGKIDVIYIDPPYNTGKADEWKYNDKFVDDNDNFRHSKWLSFMQKRLKLTKNLLSENGTIFISIDDNEVAQLKVLCNEIFGENNFVGQWNWFKSATPPNLSLKIKKNVEYILAYEKHRNNNRYKGVKKFSSSDDPFTKPQNTIKQLVFPANSVNFKLERGVIENGVYGTEKFPNKLLNDVIVENFTNQNEAIFENRFIWTQEKLNEELANNTVVNCSKSIVLSYKKQNYSEEVPPNLVDESVGVSTTEEAGKELTAMFGEKVFDYPKPVSLISYLLKFKENSTVLDFFAGSGTTGHAVLELNKEDGGNRQFILCTNNENKICEEVTYPRIKKITEGYADKAAISANVRYFKTDFVEKSEDTDENRVRLTERCYELLQIKESCYKSEKSSVENLKLWRGMNKLLAVIFDRFDSTDDQKYLSDIAGCARNADNIVVYRFSINGNLDMDISALPNARLEEIPEEILKTFNQIFKTKKKKK